MRFRPEKERYTQDGWVPEMKTYRKTTTSEAVQMTRDFEVETLEGLMQGRAGDYLMRGSAGELYICRKEIFESTFEPTEPA